MPVLPGAQQRLTPDASSSVAQYTGGIAENAQIAQGQAMSKVGGELVQMADKRRDELDQLSVVEAATALRNEGLRLTEEYTAIKGGDVLKTKLLPTYAAKFKEVSDKLAFGLSRKQQELFAPHASTAGANFQTGAMKHSIQESEKYAGDVFGNDIKSREGVAAASRLDDAQVNLQVKGAWDATLARMDTLGIRDPVSRDQMAKGVLGSIQTAVIDAHLNASDTARANEYFHRPDVQASMTQDQIEKMEKRLKPATDFAAGKLIADNAYAMWQKDKTVNTSRYIAEMAKGNPQIASDAHVLVAQYQQAQRGADQENLGVSMLAFEKGGADAAASARVQSTKAFQDLSAPDQAKFLEHARVVQHQLVTEGRSEARFQSFEERQKAADAKIAQQELWDSNLSKAADLAANPVALKKVTPAQWVAYGTEFSPKVINELKKEQQRVIKEVSKHEVDKQIFASAVANISNKVQVKTIQTLSEMKIASKKEELGRDLKPEEHAAIYREVIDETTPKAETWHGTGENPLYKMPPEKAMFFSALMGNFPDKTQYNQAWLEQMYGDQTKDVVKRAATLEVLQKLNTEGRHASPTQLEEMTNRVLNRRKSAPTAAPTAAPTTVTAPVGSKNTITPSAQPTPDELYSAAFKGKTTTGMLPEGMITAGNIDLTKRQVAHNADGSISTELSKGFNIDGKNVLIPTVVGGKIVSDAEAIAHYRATGENLGEFRTDAASNKYAEMLHKDQEKRYAKSVTTAPSPQNAAKEEARNKEITALENAERARISQESTAKEKAAAEAKQKVEAKQKAEATAAAEAKQKAEAKGLTQNQAQQLLEANTILNAAVEKAKESASTPAPVEAKGLTHNQAQQLLEANMILDAAQGKGDTSRKEAVNKVSDLLSHELLLKLLAQRQKKAGK